MRQQQVLSKAKSLGFTCQLTESNNWQISPTQPEATWQLTEVNSKWILSVKNTPQIYLDSAEAIAFLTKRKRSMREKMPPKFKVL